MLFRSPSVHDTCDIGVYGLTFRNLNLSGQASVGTNIFVEGNLSYGLDISTQTTSYQGTVVRLTSNAAITSNSFVKLALSGTGTARVEMTNTADLVVSLIGMATSSTSGSGENVQVLINGIFDVAVENGVTITEGDLVYISGVTNGRASNVVNGSPVGYALTSGTGDAGGTVTIRGYFAKN